MLNVFVKQFELVTLLTHFNAEQITHREHSYPAVAINYGKMSTADLLHSFEGLVGCLVTLNHSAQLARHVADSDSVGIASGDNDAIQDVAFGKYAQQSAAVIKHANCANVSLRHKLRRLLHGG
jgi:hypothetical protein